MQLGMIGLGRMGANMVRRLIKGGHQCVVFDRSPRNGPEPGQGSGYGILFGWLISSPSSTRAESALANGSGGVCGPTLAELTPSLAKDDIVIDGGNSYYIDDIRRAKELAKKGIHYVDVGTSGGVWGLDRGYCLMIGGEGRGRTSTGSDLRHAGARKGGDDTTPGRERPRARRNRATCIAGRTAPAISSRWSTTESSMD